MPDATMRAEGLLVKINRGLEKLTLDAIRRRLGPDMRSNRFSQELLWHHVKARKVASKDVGKVFDVAHQLLDIPGILAVEPNLVISEPRRQKFLDYPDDPKTDRLYRWHIEKVKASEARKEFSVTGEGVRVAHLDTGYTKHPELVIGTSVRADLGCDFYDNKKDPIEPLKTLKDGGHGTATASVLVGLPGKQHSDSDPAFVEGVAHGAELVPIRVDEDVWWTDLNPAKDVPAICHALKQGCQVISMSRSGSDYASLRDAIKLAISRGAIVVAAAGNCKPWCKIFSPASYPEVICAAGSTFDMTPWEKSSRGLEVTIAAPAWSVYRARTVKKNNAYAFDVARSYGTSYATPIVAGAAALWIQRHGGATALAEKLKGPERIPVVYKYLLRKTAQPGKDWDTNKFGPGILDCFELLSADLPKAEDIPKIENDLRSQSKTSKAGVAELVLACRISVADDPRAVHLYSLEIEAEGIRSARFVSLLEVDMKESSAADEARAGGLAETLTKAHPISTALRRKLES